MKNNGFTLVELLAVIVILAIILVIAIPTVGNIINSSRYKVYTMNEDMLIRSAKLYASTNEEVLPINVGDTKTMSINALKSEKFILSITDPADKSECDGSVLIKKIASSEYEYTPFLSCGSNYESSKYNVNGLIADYKLNDNANDATSLSSNGVVNGAISVKDRNSLNLVNNGNFAIDANIDGKADGWSFNSMSSTSIANNIQRSTSTVLGGNLGYSIANSIGHIYYYSVEVKANSSLVRLNNGFEVTPHSGSGNFEKLSWRYVSTSSGKPHNGLYDDRASGWSEIQIKNAQHYDLTDIFGAGHEPSKQWCDENLSSSNSKAYYFDGVDDYIQMSDTSNLRMNTGGTISAWIYPRSIGENSYGRIIDKSTTAGANNGYLLTVGINNVLFFQCETTSTISTDNAITLNAWNYVTVTFNSSGRKLYVNGTEVTSIGGTITTLPLNVAGPVAIGNRVGVSDRTFDGYIDDVRLYNRVLSATEIMSNYTIEK